jgi:Chitobiase/beta-hexosaminidase C-terminal domain/Beta-propeller repeat/NHL repeat
MRSLIASRFPAFRLSIFLFSVASAFAFSQAPPQHGQPASYGNLPLLFEANQGQTDPSVQAVAHGQGYTLFLRQGEAVFSLRTSGAAGSIVRMQLVGANPHAAVAEEVPQITRTNYFFGKDPNQWHTDIPNYSRIRNRSIYEGIDQVYYGNQRRLEHDFVVAPGADPGKIVLALNGAKTLSIDPDTGDLIVNAGSGELRLQKPIAYQQQVNGPRTEIPSSYKLLAGNKVAFTLGRYNRQQPLIIDPVLSYSTYLGGSGNNGNGDQGNGIAVDASGDAYIVGTAYSTDFPATTGAYQTQDKASSGNSTIFVSELNAAGTALLYSTYLGGSGGDFGYGIALDSNNNAYITGATYSTDFPVTCGALQINNPSTTAGAATAFVASLNSDGTVLRYSTYLGGEGNTSTTSAQGDVAQAIAVNPGGNAYVTGYTFSPDFPVTDNAFQQSFAGSATLSNAFVTELNLTGTGLVYSTYLGGSGAAGGGDYGNAIALDSSGDAFIAGSTGSANFPVTSGTFQPTLNGPSNAFVAKLSPDGSSQIYSTYLGGAGVPYSFYYGGTPFTSEYTESTGDSAQALAIDSLGNAYIAGITSSNNFPLTAGALEGTGTELDAYVGPIPYAGPYTVGVTAFPPVAFVTKLNQDGSALDYSTFLEGQSTAVKGLAVDGTGHAYIAGSAPTLIAGIFGGFQSTPDALPLPASTGASAFLVKLDPAATVLNYATLLGGSSNDGANALALDSAGNVYLTGFATSTDFPTTAGALQTRFGQSPTAPIPTTVSLVSRQFECDAHYPAFDVVANFMINSNSTGPAPTGNVHFWGTFVVDDNELVVPNGGGTAIVQVIGASSSAVQQSASWEADYSGDPVYAPSSLTGTTTGPGNCDSQPFARPGSGAKASVPRVASIAHLASMTSLSNRLKANETVRNADVTGNSNAFVSKFALASEANTTTYPALANSGTPIPTTLSVISSEASWDSLGDCSDYSATWVLGLSTGIKGPPPTGDVQLFGPWEDYYDYPMTGSWGVPMSQVTVSGSAEFFVGVPGGVYMTANYLGDSIYQASSVSGNATLPPCTPYFTKGIGSSAKSQKPQGHIQFQMRQGTMPSTQAAGGALAGKPASSVTSTVHGAKFTPPPANPRKMSSIRPADSPATCLAPAVAIPVFSLAAGTYNGTQTVSITDATVGATIYYTVDGSIPSASSTRYTVPLSLSASETIKAIAIASPAAGLANSPVAIAAYTIIPPPIATPVLSLPAGTYNFAPTITITDTALGAIIYVTFDGTDPDPSTGYAYTSPVSFSIFSSETIKAIATSPGYSNSTIATAAYTIVPVPAFSTVNIGASATVSVTVAIPVAATIGSISALTQGAANQDFTNAGGGTCVVGTAYSADATCTVNVAFAPKYPGTRYGALLVQDSAGAELANIYLEASGVGSQANFLPGTETTVAMDLNQPNGLVVDGSGNLYISDTSNNRVVKETWSAGSYTESTLFTGLNAPEGLAVDGAGNIYIADSNNDQVLKETLVNGQYTQSTVATGLHRPNGIAVDGNGNVYIADAYGAQVVLETLSGGSYVGSSIYGCGYFGSQSCPSSVAIDGSGNIFITAYNSTQVMELVASNNTVAMIGSGLNGPSCIVVDGNGNLYIADTLNNRIVKETLSGGSYTQSVVHSSPLNSPLAVAVDQSGNLYISDSNNKRVLKEDLADPPSLAFASTAYGATSSDSPQTVMVSNSGNAALNLSAISYPSDFPEDTSATGDCATSSPVAAAATCTLTVDFKPLATSGSNTTIPLAEQVTLTSNTLNAAGTQQAIAVSGTETLTATSTPTFSPAAGTYTSAQSVTIADTTPGAVIHYTIDGSTPTASSTQYIAPISIGVTQTLQAIAIAPGYASSAVASALYTINLLAAATPTFSPAAGTYTSAQSATIADTTPGAAIHYTIDGSTPIASSPLYSTAISVSSTETIQAIAIAPGYTNSAVASATYTINPPAAAPTFSPAAGAYTTAQSVTIADTTPGAAIYYTIDGSTPTVTSTAYTAAISVGATETIQAIAIAPGYSSSPVASAAYTINLPPPSFTISASTSSLTIEPGQSGTVTISVTPQNGFTGATTFSCTGLPAGATCTFAPPSVTQSGGVATTTLTVSASSTASLSGGHSRLPFSGKLPGATLALALCCIGWRKRRSAKLLLLALATVSLGSALLTGCGGSSKPKLVTSTVSVIATSGSVQQTVPITITIE